MAFTSVASKPISNSPAARKISLAIFGSVFALMGVGFLIPVFCLPAIHIIEAQTWRQVPCTILHSEVVSHPGSKGGSTYNIKVSFSYTFGDTHYVGTRYDFSIGSSSGRDYRDEIVGRLHRGAHTVCYVNPNHPSEAVIDRGLDRNMWFAIIPLVFVAIGLALIIGAVRTAHPKPLSSSSGTGASALRGNPANLKEAQSPFGKLIAIAAIALFWNGIVSVFFYHAYLSPIGPREGSVWFLRIFLIPFILVGLGLIFGWFYQLLALFNPRAQIVLTNEALSLGQSTELRWNFSGNYSRISRLTINLEGREQAKYQRGTTTQTDNSTFARIRVTDTTRQMDIGSGRGIFSIPADTMHSFSARNNKIIWTIAVHGEIAGWPDVKTEFPINVGPVKKGHS